MSEHETPQKPPSRPITLERVVEVLEKGVVQAEHGLMRYSSNYTFLISVAFEDVTLPSVYKPQRGERPLWDFPEGTLCYREVAAFLTSQELGWQLVPPTVLREGPRGLGSVQFYIEHDPELNYFSFEPSMIPQLRVMAAFDYLVNNADRKGGHCLVDNQGHLWGIDHGITFHSQHKLRTVIWDFADQPVPDNLLADLDRLCSKLEDPEHAYRRALKDLLSGAEIRAFQGRVRHLLRTRRYPQPGSGPNYPWPPV
ncbi:MAG: SCO1664 family protein [Chloroflexi bacterium]|nr:SCO1664 family protein [Chloroflexota bacterium]